MNSKHLSKFVNLLLFLLLITQVNAQDHQCGTPHRNEAQVQEIIRKMGRNASRNSSCVDPVWTRGTQTYNLILEYSESLFGQTNAVNTANSILNFYSPYGINFNISLKPNQCTDCILWNSSSWGSSPNSHYNKNCIYGRLVKGDGSSTLGTSTYQGFFWANQHDLPTIFHEIGHELGLDHTFAGGFDPYNHELVKPSNDCSCDCLFKGDLVCDTPSDPYKNGQNSWNNDMFDYTTNTFRNLRNVVDYCGTNFNQVPNQLKVIRNLMSYHRPQVDLEPGQISFMKLYSSDKPWLASSSNTSVISMAGINVNSPLIIDTDINYTSDVTLSSTLIIKNCKVTLSNGAKLILNDRAQLSLDNGTITASALSTCEANAPGWAGVVINGNFTKIVLRNNSEISKSTNACISTFDRKAEIYVQSGSRIFNVGKDALDLKSFFGIVDISSNSSVTGNINLGTKVDSGAALLRIKNSTINQNRSDSDIFITNVNVYIANSFISGSIVINNSRFKNIEILKNTVFNITILNQFGVTKVIENNVRGILDINNTSKIDIIDNNFYKRDPILVKNFVGSAKSLYFKNNFLPGNNSINIKNSLPTIHLECNKMKLSSDADWSITGDIATNQGDQFLAAGNFFSRSPVEIKYNNSAIVNYWYRDLAAEKPVSIIESIPNTFRNREQNEGTRCDLDYPRPPDYPPSCSNGIKDTGELGIDCGGSCPPCSISDIGLTVDLCGDRIKNGDETGIDCGGIHCPPCTTCNDGIRNDGETGIDCGGPYCPPCNVTLCNNGILDAGESTVDCGGTCPPCVVPPPPTGGSCTDGILNNGEVDIDCGGVNCTPCSTHYCNNGIRDHGETGIDCGGPCTPCGSTCNYDGIQNNGESGIDCGGPCPQCTYTCNNDGIRNNGETGIDCGGPCPPCYTITYLPSCYNGIKDGNETGIDCGGDCPKCITYNPPTTGEGNTTSKTPHATIIDQSTLSFIAYLRSVYGTSYFPSSSHIDLRSAKFELSLLEDGGKTDELLGMISTSSTTHPNQVIQAIMDVSPYVSVKVITALLNKSIHFQSQDIANLIIANPRLIEDISIRKVVFNSPTFTPAQVQNIKLAVIAGDVHTQKRIELDIKTQYSQCISRLQISKHYEGMTPDYNGIRSELLGMTDPNVAYDIYETFIDEGQFNFANTYLYSIDLSAFVSTFDKDQMIQFRVLNDILMNHYYAGNRVVAMSELTHKEVQRIALGCYGHASLKASIVLMDLYSEAIEANQNCGNIVPYNFAQIVELRLSDDQKYTLSPNPTTDKINIVANEVNQKANHRITIYDLSGSLVGDEVITNGTHTLSLSSWKVGVYIYTIQEGDNVIQQGKFFKIK